MSVHEYMIIEKLRECQNEIPELQAKKVDVIRTAEFSRWKDKVNKWLKQGGARTSDEQARFDGLTFVVFRQRLFRGFDSDDQRHYLEDLGRARYIIDSAIENLELGMGARAGASAKNIEESQGEYTQALICKNGHVRSLDYRPSAPKEAYCTQCGAEAISTCPKCGEPIHGEYIAPGETDVSESYSVPNHCHACGVAYPWTKARQAAIIDLIQQMPNLSSEEQQKLIESVPALGEITPQTEGAILRMKRALKNAGPEIGPRMTRLLRDYGPDIVKTGLELLKPR
jgi:hypothetical protein